MDGQGVVGGQGSKMGSVRYELAVYLDDRKTYKNVNDPWNLKHLNTKIQNLCYELHNAPKNILSEMIDA